MTEEISKQDFNFYECNNGDNYFEFEITIVKNTELFK